MDIAIDIESLKYFTEKHLVSHLKSLGIYEDINLYIKDDSLSIREKLYCFLNKVMPSKCYCGNNLKFLSIVKGYQIFCSPGCVSRNEEVKRKMKETCLENWGVEHASQNKDVIEKSRKTCLEKYGFDHQSKNKDIKEKSSITNRKRNIEVYVSNLKFKQFSLITPKESVINSTKEFIVKCDLCDRTFIHSCLNIQDVWCICRQFSSSGERDVKTWLKETLNIECEKSKKLIYPYEIDIYIPEHKLAIEYNGLVWHSEFGKGNDVYHLQKTLECQEKGIQLIHIFENEWLYKQEIVKSIIKAKLGIFDERIFARKCIVKEIKQHEYNEFLELNHLQGKSISKIRLGLFYNNELVSVMGFGKSRFKKDETELIRFANKLDTSVLGGFSKLLKYYIVNYKPDNLVSYCDLRYFDGSGYLKNGFEIVSRSKPNYFYITKKREYVLHSRQQFQKHKLKDKLDVYDESLTEWENMNNNGYYRIWDCGNLKLKFKKVA